MEGGEQQLPRCRGRDTLTGDVGTCGIRQAELRGLFGSPEYLERLEGAIVVVVVVVEPTLCPPSPGHGYPIQLPLSCGYLGTAPGGAAALATDSHAEALEAAVRVLLAQVEEAI